MSFLRVDTTERGFVVYEFEDHNGEPCTLQQSSLADKSAIWLGCENNHPPHHVTGEEMSPRMHLTRAQVRELLPVLQYFAETGKLPSERMWTSFHVAKGEG